jgi:hypothetical protein
MRKLTLGLGLAAGLVLAFALAAAADPPATLGDLQKGAALAAYPADTVKACRVTVATTATALSCGVTNRRQVCVRNCGAADIQIGDGTVTAAAGFTIKTTDTIWPCFDAKTAALGYGAALDLRGIVSTGTQAACVLELK